MSFFKQIPEQSKSHIIIREKPLELHSPAKSDSYGSLSIPFYSPSKLSDAATTDYTPDNKAHTFCACSCAIL